MSIYETTHGWGVDWRDEFGRRRRQFIGDRTAAAVMDARLRESVQLASSAQRNFRASATLSPEAARDVYLASAARAPASRANLHARLTRLLHALSLESLEQLTPQLLKSWYEKRHQEIAPTSLAQECSTVRNWCDWLAANWYIAASPARDLPRKYPQAAARRPLTYQEELDLLNECSPSMRLRVLLALDAGLRLGEAHAMRRNHVNLDDATLTVWATKNRTLRAVPTTYRLEAALSSWCQGLLPDAVLFPGRTGQQMNSPQNSFHKLSRRLLRRPTFHDLRHTFASRLAAASKNLTVVRVLLGHKPATSTELYLHASIDDCREAILQMERHNPNLEEKENNR